MHFNLNCCAKVKQCYPKCNLGWITSNRWPQKNYVMLFWATAVGHVGGSPIVNHGESWDENFWGGILLPPKNEGKTGTTWRLNNFKIMIMCITYWSHFYTRLTIRIVNVQCSPTYLPDILTQDLLLSRWAVRKVSWILWFCIFLMSTSIYLLL